MPAKKVKATETSEETKHRWRPATVVAKLMGLESLPMPQPVLSLRQRTYDSYSHSALMEANKHFQWPEDECSDRYDTRLFADEEAEYKDVYEIGEQPFMSSTLKPEPLLDESQGTYDDDYKCFRKKMSLVQQKFSDAKRIAMDNNPLRSKEFQDAIAFLSSNRELFLKLFEDPNSLLSEYRRGTKSSPLPSQTKCITVLKPSIATVEKDSEDLGGKSDDARIGSSGELSRYCWSSGSGRTKSPGFSRPTRIVVLKPNPQAHRAVNRKGNPQLPSPNAKSLSSQGTFGATQADETIESRKLARKITQLLRGTLSGHQTEDDLFFSALSNGYVGDESSSNRSESDDMEKESGSLSDSEMVTATSSRSCDYTNMLGSPNSFSSFSRASYSPESYVVKEAKKRLAHRLALVNANVNNHDHGLERSSSGTLAEMLALSEAYKKEGYKVSSGKFFNAEQNMEVPSALFSSGQARNVNTSMKSSMELSRSKSVPISLSTYEGTKSDTSSSSLINNPIDKKDVAKSVKSSLKGKVSKFFFSKSKKKNKNSDCRQQPSSVAVESFSNEGLKRFPLDSRLSQSEVDNDSKIVASTFTTSLGDGSNQHSTHSRNQGAQESFIERHEQASLVSVGDTQLTDYVNNSLFNISENAKMAHPQALGRSRPIESVARSLSTDNSSETKKPLKISSIFSKAEEEREQFLFIKRLLSSARFDTRSGTTTYAIWHSSESPLNPLLLDEHLNMKDEVVTCTLTRSLKQLLFDCINAILLDISQRTTLAAYPWAKACGRAKENGPNNSSLADEVWQSISNWNSCGKCMSAESNRSINGFVNSLVMKEATEWQLAECVWLEMYEFSKDVGGKILEELLEESLSELFSW